VMKVKHSAKAIGASGAARGVDEVDDGSRGLFHD
jgi:hypothetical protein